MKRGKGPSVHTIKKNQDKVFWPPRNATVLADTVTSSGLSPLLLREMTRAGVSPPWGEGLGMADYIYKPTPSRGQLVNT